MRKVIKRKYDNKEFKLTISTECGGPLICVKVKELTRPNWKIFRYSWRCTKYRWLHDYDSIEHIVENVMKDYFKSVRRDEEQRKKLNFFSKNY